LNQAPNDREILLGCLKKDRKYQKALFEKYFSDMMAVCIRYTKDEDEAKDVVQDGFIKVFGKIEGFAGEGNSLKSWIHRIMVHTSIDHYRATRRDMKLLEAFTDKDEAEEAEIEGQMATDEILKIVQSLPETQRAVFNLYVMEGFSHKEIAGEIGTTEGASKWHLCEARKSLKKMLELQNPVKMKEYA
jgi:RNA polymerase sigma factor (sigma-70 family)